MPFLNRDIILELLKTYPNATQIEEKYGYDSFMTTHKEDPSLFLQMFRNSAGYFGYNTPDKSEAVYLEIRALVDAATKNNSIEAWTDIITRGGDGAYTTYINSFRGSKLSLASFAIIMYIRNQIDERIKFIEGRVKAAEEKIRFPDTKLKSLEERIKLLKDKIALNADDELALKIHASITQRILEEKEFIQGTARLTKLSDKLAHSTVFANTLDINKEAGKAFHSSSSELVEAAQRHLCFLGDDSIEKQLTKELKQKLFPKFPFYADQISVDYNLTNPQTRDIKLNLPIWLQNIYPALYISDIHKQLRPLVKENKAIESFEQLVLINMAEKQSVMHHDRISSTVHEAKEPVQTPLSQTKKDLIVDTEPLTPISPIMTQQVDVTKDNVNISSSPSPLHVIDEEAKPEPSKAAMSADNTVSQINAAQPSKTGLFKTKSDAEGNSNPSPAAPDEVDEYDLTF